MTITKTTRRYNQPKSTVNTVNRTFATSLSASGATAPKMTNAATIAAEMINGEFTERRIFDSVEDIADLTLDEVNERLKNQLDPDNYCLSVVVGEEQSEEQSYV